MKAHHGSLWLTILLVAGLATAQPVIAPSGVRNSASFAFQGLPNADIAQGSIFTVLLSSALPVPNQLLSAYPVPTVFNGASMKVTVGGTSVDVLMFGTAQNSSGSQLDGILPSSTPVGAGTITVTYNGQTSAAAPINVVGGSFAWYTATSQGFGPGAFTDLKYQYLTPTHAANPGDTVIGWGTGLGPVSGNEAAGGLPGALKVAGLSMWVGGQPVTPMYTGRADFPGEDQINFQIPQGVSGCAVPVILQIGTVVSNTATMPIAASGGACSDPTGFSATDLQSLATKGSFAMGAITLDRTSTSVTLPGSTLPVLSIVDSITGVFSKLVPANAMTASGPFPRPSSGTCTVFTYGGTPIIPNAPVGSPADAGTALNISGPAGAKQVPKQSPGMYSLTISGVPYLNPGAYSIDDGSGGMDVGPFKVSFNIPNPLTWTNEASITSVNRSQGVTVTWSGGDQNSYATISGSSSTSGPQAANVGAMFTCTAPISAGTFTVPPSVLLALPQNSGTTPATSFLGVGSGTLPMKFTAPGLDAGYVTSTSSSAKNVSYQ
jgi:uncharacterized protein (TIGR03437 family)